MLSFIEAYQKELEQEAVQTRKMLAIVPADKMDWQPHPKSMTIKALATHLAEIPIMITIAVTQDKWDFAGSPYNPADYPNATALVERFDECVSEAQAALASASDDILRKEWILCDGDTIYGEFEKWEAIRHAFGQNAHHRAQLGVFLRLLDIPIPGPYGPSADEMQAAYA